jgi:hypothetical protein
MRHYVELGMLERACEFAVMAAPYMHPRLAAIKSSVQASIHNCVVSDEPMSEEEWLATFGAKPPTSEGLQ